MQVALVQVVGHTRRKVIKMSYPPSYVQRKQMREHYLKSIKKVKVDKKSAEKIFKIIREKSQGIMDNNVTYSIGSNRTETLISRIKDHIKEV